MLQDIDCMENEGYQGYHSRSVPAISTSAGQLSLFSLEQNQSLRTTSPCLTLDLISSPTRAQVYSRWRSHAVQIERMSERRMMAKRRAMATLPRVLKLRATRVSFWVWQTSSTISSPMNSASSKALQILKNRFLLSPVKRMTSMCTAWVRRMRYSWAFGLEVREATTSASHHSYPKRYRLQNRQSQPISPCSQMSLWINRKKISWQRLEYSTDFSAPSYSCLQRRQRKCAIGQAVAMMKATTAAAADTPEKEPWLVRLVREENWRKQARMRVRYWQKMTELKQKQGRRWNVILRCRQNRLEFAIRREMQYFVTKCITSRYTRKMAKAMPMLQMLRKKFTSVQQLQRQEGEEQYSYSGRAFSQTVGFIAMFWFCTYRNPLSAYFSSAGAVRAARKMCNHIFCRLCMKWVQTVCRPRKKTAKPMQMTARETTQKKVRTPLTAEWFSRGVKRCRVVPVSVLSTTLLVAQVGVSRREKKGYALMVSEVSVVTISGQRQTRERLPRMVSFSGQAWRVQVTLLLERMQQGRATPLICREKMCWKRVALLLRQVRLKETCTLRAESQVYCIRQVKGQARHEEQPTGYTSRLPTPKVRVALLLDTTWKYTLRVELESVKSRE